MARWGMVVDLGRCVGCQTCTIACKMENGLPPSTLWRTVLDVETGEYPEVSRTFVPLTCMHCADPPCHDACPTTATRVRDDGIVWIADDICIGCGSCVVACPYQARHLVSKESYYFGDPTPSEKATFNRERVGICTKCHFCYHKFDEAPAGVQPGEDPLYTPSCSSSCIGNAILFGDFENPQSTVSRMVQNNPDSRVMLEHLGTQPHVYYLNVPELEPQKPELQHSWHGLAVSNFFCGTTGAGLFLAGAVMGWFRGVSAPLINLGDIGGSLSALPGSITVNHLAGLLGPLLVIVGLLSVAAEAGRPFRGFNVFRNLGRSWMSRESAFAMLFVALGLLDTLFIQSVWVQAVAALSGMGLVLAQGLILSKAKGVPAWSVPLMPGHFILSAMANGTGALLLLSGLSAKGSPGALLLQGVVLLVANWFLWRLYLATPPRTGTFTQAVKVLNQGNHRIAIEVVGHLLPAVLLLVGFLTGSYGLLAALAGLAMVAGGLWSKWALIMKAAFLVDLFDGFRKGVAKPDRDRSEEPLVQVAA